MRATMHWLTPLPNKGGGCMPKLPKRLMEKLDLDGDGKVSAGKEVVGEKGGS
jgi:hypothetical protein